MFVDFVLGWGANFVGIVKGGRVSKSLRTSVLDWTRMGDRQLQSHRTMEKLLKLMQLQLHRQQEEM